MAGDFVDRARRPWSVWFRRIRHLRSVRTMAIALYAQRGPDDGDWRELGEDAATLRDSATGH
jgi:hypothetical protein